MIYDLKLLPEKGCYIKTGFDKETKKRLFPEQQIAFALKQTQLAAPILNATVIFK